MPTEDVLRFGTVEVRTARRQLLVDGRPATIGARAFDVLVMLLEHRDRVVSKDELIARVWAGLVVDENNLQVQISALRKLLGVAAIATIPARGYRFVAPVERAPAGQGTASAADEPERVLVTSLPTQRTAFFGRERDLRHALAYLQDGPVLSLIGIGGSGKTRLALQVAREAQARLADTFPDGVAFVDLAAVGDAQDVEAIVASGLGVREVPGTPILQLLQRSLGATRRLLVLDNCEHLLEPVARLVDALLGRCESVRVLVTSREALGIEGERVLPVGGLPLANAEDVEALRNCDAVRLFADRARAVNPDFEIDEHNAGAVHEVCRRLDGIPLALELAAARLGVMTVDQLRSRLDDRFRLLTGGRRALPRQQTLDAVVRWSYEHLSIDEQRLLQRLAVFSGSSTIEAAVFVSAGEAPEHQVIEQLSSLAAKSLITLTSHGPEPRHRMLETVRVFALERLDQSGHAGAARDRHLAFFENRANELTHHPDAGIRSRATALLDADRDNLIAALRHGANGGDAAAAWRLALLLGGYWERRGIVEIGYALLEALFSATEAALQGPARDVALRAVRIVAVKSGDFRRAMRLAEEQLQLARALGDEDSELNAIQAMVVTALALDDARQAWSHVESMEALAARRSEVPDTVRHMKAETLRALGRLDEAEALYRQNLEQAAMRGDAGAVIHGAINLALLSLARPDLETARKWIERVIELRARGDHGVYGVPYVLFVAAALRAANQDGEAAARLHGAAEAHLHHTGQRLEPIDIAPLAPFLAQARSAIAGEAYARAFDEGRALDQRSILSLVDNCLPRRAQASG